MRGTVGTNVWQIILKSLADEFFAVRCESPVYSDSTHATKTLSSPLSSITPMTCPQLFDFLHALANMTVTTLNSLNNGSRPLADYTCDFGTGGGPVLTIVRVHAGLLTNGSAPLSPEGTELVDAFNAINAQCFSPAVDPGKFFGILMGGFVGLIALVVLCVMACTSIPCKQSADTRAGYTPIGDSAPRSCASRFADLFGRRATGAEGRIADSASAGAGARVP